MLPGMKISASNLNDKQFLTLTKMFYDIFYSKETRISNASFLLDRTDRKDFCEKDRRQNAHAMTAFVPTTTSEWI